MICHLWVDGSAPGPDDVDAETLKLLITLTCEVCRRNYLDSYDPKEITRYNVTPVNYYCCSLKCECASWDSDFVPI